MPKPDDKNVRSIPHGMNYVVDPDGTERWEEPDEVVQARKNLDDTLYEARQFFEAEDRKARVFVARMVFVIGVAFFALAAALVFWEGF